MRILILTQYFPPETGAPQNRLFDLAMHLQKKAEIHILTAFPNYLRKDLLPEHKGKWFMKDSIQGLTIYRSYIYVPSNASIFARLVNYFSFVVSSLWNGLFKLGKYDWIICESPPLFLGITAMILKKVKGSKLNFNVSDLWPESAEKLGLIKNRTILKFTTWLEETIYRSSDTITGQTQGIVSNIASRFPSKRIFWLRNGVDLQAFYNFLSGRDWRKENGFLSTDVIVFYGGLMGHAQGLTTVLQAARIVEPFSNVKFVLMGEGPEKKSLMETASSFELKNVTFCNGVARQQLADVINAVDMVIVPLKKVDLFLGAIPSKIFEALAMEKPVLLGVDGEAKELFVEKGKCALFYTPESHQELAAQIRSLASDSSLRIQLGKNGKSYVMQVFDRKKISGEFWDFLNQGNGSN